VAPHRRLQGCPAVARHPFNFDEEGALTMALDEVSHHPTVVTDGEGHQLEMKQEHGDQAPGVFQGTQQQSLAVAGHHIEVR